MFRFAIMMKQAGVFLRQQKKTLFQVISGLFFIGLAIYFISQQHTEIEQVKGALIKADPLWIASGFFLILVFILVQGLMYVYSFKAIQQKIGLQTGVSLYLKRNLVSVFLPAGMLTNMAFFNREVEKRENVTRSQIYFASSIFSLCSIGTGILLGVPALVWLYLKSSLSNDIIYGFALSMVLLLLLVYVILSITRKGRVYKMITQRFPSLVRLIQDLRSQPFRQYYFWMVILLSLVIEVIGIAHLYFAVEAVGGQATLAMSVIGFSIVVLILSSSPFLRGIGAIEVALGYVLTLFGLSATLAITSAFIFRFFQFWGVLLSGLLAFIPARNQVVRLLPAILLFGLGIVNVLSAVSPSLFNGTSFLPELLHLRGIDAAQLLILVAGFIILAISILLARGLRHAWIWAISLSVFSIFVHFKNGVTNWEEASLAGLVFFTLIYQKDHFLPAKGQKFSNNLLASLVSPVEIASPVENDFKEARALVRKYGRSNLDSYLTYRDKQLWFSDDREAFISFKTTNTFALVLENPVCKHPDEMDVHIRNFDAYVRSTGRKVAYYRVPEASYKTYRSLGKKLLPIGLEATVDLTTFTMAGKERASIRYNINKLKRSGYIFSVLQPPYTSEFMDQLKSVSDEWLESMNRKELLFSQGMFDPEILAHHTIFTMQDENGSIIGFINQVEDGIEGEASFDLMRKTADAPRGTMEFLFVHMFKYLKEQGFSTCDLGLVPLAGIDQPGNLQERAIRHAYHKMKKFSHFRSLHSFKNKFNPHWEVKYLAYDASVDLVYLPLALEKVMKA